MDAYTYYFIIFIILLGLGYGAGKLNEKKHYRTIVDRERAYLHLPAFTTKSLPSSDERIISAKLVYGSAVISADYFKRFLAGLRNIFGGTVTSYQSLMDRARRESLLRMKEMAIDASMIINVRIETSTIGKTSSKNNAACLEAIAYGTALFLEK
jgi:uncharacterized protein YbjQ (UPF0145 family)